MALTTEFKKISKGVTWTRLIMSGESFSIQNTCGVMMEYSFTDDIEFGSYLTPYTILSGLRQDLYVRFHNVDQSGTISITREI